MSSPRPVAPISGTPQTSALKRTQRVHWMQRFIEVLTSAPIYLSSPARLFSATRLVAPQEVHPPFAPLLDHRRARRHFRWLTLRSRAAIAHVPGTARDRLRRTL